MGLGVTTERFILYTSNLFAISGLRTFCFVLQEIAKRLYYLIYGLAFVLSFIGIKMLLPVLVNGLIMIVGDQSRSGFTEILQKSISEEYEPTILNISRFIVVGAILVSMMVSVILPHKANSRRQ